MDAGVNSGVTSIGFPSASVAGIMLKTDRMEAAAICSIDFAIWAPGHILHVPNENMFHGLRLK